MGRGGLKAEFWCKGIFFGSLLGETLGYSSFGFGYAVEEAWFRSIQQSLVW